MVAYTKITDATQATSPVADTAAFPADVSSTDRYVDAGQLRRVAVREITSSGAQSGAGAADLHIRLNHASAINYTITGAPTVGDRLTLKVNTSAAHTLILSGSVTFDGANQTATFSTAGDSLIMVAISTTEWDIVYNNGATLS